MRQSSTQNKNNETSEIEKTPTVVIRKIRDAILDDVFKPGDWLPELDLAKRFEDSRSPVREALLALEKEGTVQPGLKKPRDPGVHEKSAVNLRDF
jgi:DNA-binding GntR family transcriptional regulator